MIKSIRNIIEFENVKKIMGSRVIINNINFTVKQGNVFGFIGPNGAGKTTTIKLMLNFLKAEEGRVSLFNKDVNSLDNNIKRRISVLFDANILNPLLKVKEELELFYRLYGVKDYKNKIMYWLEKLNIMEYENYYVKQLSLGLSQKVSLAKVLGVNADLIILDEPFNNLDVSSQFELCDLINKLNTSENKTFFISSHNLSNMEKICDSLAFIQKGKIIESGEIEFFKRKYFDNIIIIKLKGDSINRFIGILDKSKAFEYKTVDKNTIELHNVNPQEGNRFYCLFDLIKKNNLEIHSIAEKEFDFEDIYRRIINEN